MSRDEQLRRLVDATDNLLDENSGWPELTAGLTEIETLFTSMTATAESVENPELDAVTRFETGKAISPRDAARCLQDISRTVGFMRGVRAAIGELASRFPGQRLHVIYAGCGPFALQVVPHLSWLSDLDIRFTLIDAHEVSLDSARQIIESLGFGDFVEDYVQGDAVEYRPPAGRPVHMVISECMQKALERESQVAITAALAPLLEAGGILIPEKITVQACLADRSREFIMWDPEDAADIPEEPLDKRARVALGTLIELSRSSAEEIAGVIQTMDGSSPSSLEPKILTIPEIADRRIDSLMLRTSVQIFDSIRLDDYDSGITYPTMLNDMGMLAPGERLEFRYRLGETPGFECRRLNP